MRYLKYVVLLTSLCASMPATGAPPQSLAEYKAIYEREIVGIRTNVTGVVEAEKQYLKALEILENTAKASGDFPGTKAVITERQRFESCKVIPNDIPEGTPPGIANAQKNYHATMSLSLAEQTSRTIRITQLYVGALRKYIAALLQQNKMDEAEAVNTEIQRAEAELAKLKESQPATVDSPVTPTSTPQAEPTSRALPLSLQNGLVLYFPFDSRSDRTTMDASGKGNHGTVQGAVYTQKGCVGGAYEFHGNDPRNASGIKVLHSVTLNSPCKTRQITIALWIKPYSIPHEFPVVVSKGGNTYPNAFGGYEVVFNANGDNDIIFASGAYGAWTQRANGKWVNHHLNEWIHIVVTLADSFDKCHFYVNGVRANDETQGGSSISDALAPIENDLYIGQPDPESARSRTPFDGLIDEVMIYNRVLTDAEISQIFALQSRGLRDSSASSINESGLPASTAAKRRTNGFESNHASADARGVPSGHTFWIDYRLNSANTTFTADWGYEQGGGNNGVVSLPVRRTSSGWRATGLSRNNHPVLFEQNGGELRMEWGARLEQKGSAFARVVWP